MNNIMDVGFIGLPLTWWNSRQKENAIYERLDKVVANLAWINMYKEACVENLPIVGQIMITSPFYGKSILAKRYPPFSFILLVLMLNGYYMKIFIE